MGSAASAPAQLRDVSEAELRDLMGAAPELLRCRVSPQQLEAFGEAITRVARQEKPQDLRAEWQRPSSWPAKKQVAAPGKDAMHVVLSTKFQEPWLTVSIGMKEILIERGCTVYNPNTDNAEMFKEEANDRWLLTFNEHLQKVKDTKGFVLQIQQGAQRDRSYMQLAEEKQSAWLQVPRIGLFAFPTTKTRGGFVQAEEYLGHAVEAARRQWAQGIRPEVEMVSEVFEPLGAWELPLDEHGDVHGRARCTWPDGTVYEGEFQHGKVHDRGIYKFPNGKVETVLYEQGKVKGPGVKLSADRKKAWLLRDGKKERELSVSEAREKAKELGLPELPP